MSSENVKGLTQGRTRSARQVSTGIGDSVRHKSALRGSTQRAASTDVWASSTHGSRAWSAPLRGRNEAGVDQSAEGRRRVGSRLATNIQSLGHL